MGVDRAGYWIFCSDCFGNQSFCKGLWDSVLTPPFKWLAFWVLRHHDFSFTFIKTFSLTAPISLYKS
uniref:Uncharacterized protein n=1 Tax=Siphoviridae sp. ctx254 TaxID=2825737 RepID=A0A8S5TVT0_9CAUD|nr:MAG TPA: hypothetical protein [Siphoviridae sp. ctx254]